MPALATRPPSAEPDPLFDVVAGLGAEADAASESMAETCRIPDDLYGAAARDGLFRQLVPASLGGLGDDPLTWFRRGVAMAWCEPSFGWVVTQGAAELAWIAAGGDEAWAAEVLGDPRSTSASTTAGLGSLRIHGDTATFSGAWSFDTGCQGATWLGGLAMVDDPDGALPGGGSGLRMCWVPAGRAQIREDWDATGMRATGSHSIVVPEQEIPSSWTIDLFTPTANRRGPHRCLVGNGNWPIAGAVAATQLGAARRALDECCRLVADKAPAPEFIPLADNAGVQRRLADLEGRWLAAHASVERELTAMWEDACDSEGLGAERRWRLAVAHATASRVAVETVTGVAELTGTAVAARRGVIARCLRDVHTLAGHIAVSGGVAERAGRVRLGRAEPDLLV